MQLRNEFTAQGSEDRLLNIPVNDNQDEITGRLYLFVDTEGTNHASFVFSVTKAPGATSGSYALVSASPDPFGMDLELIMDVLEYPTVCLVDVYANGLPDGAVIEALFTS